jgi:hypothetical protein
MAAVSPSTKTCTPTERASGHPLFHAMRSDPGRRAGDREVLSGMPIRLESLRALLALDHRGGAWRPVGMSLGKKLATANDAADDHHARAYNQPSSHHGWTLVH